MQPMSYGFKLEFCEAGNCRSKNGGKLTFPIRFASVVAVLGVVLEDPGSSLTSGTIVSVTFCLDFSIC